MVGTYGLWSILGCKSMTEGGLAALSALRRDTTSSPTPALDTQEASSWAQTTAAWFPGSL
jgi:hypothetical protein